MEGEYTSETKLTVKVEIFVEEFKKDRVEAILQLWDFGVQNWFTFLLETYTLGTMGALLMFDLTRYSTLKPLHYLFIILRKRIPELQINE